MTSNTSMALRWGFLSPWCAVLKQRIHCSSRIREGETWDHSIRHLSVLLPTRSDEDGMRYLGERQFGLRFQKVREALALLAAVAHVDKMAWNYLLESRCRVDMKNDWEEVFEDEIPVHFELYLDLEGKRQQVSRDIDYDLVKFCGVHQRKHLSDGFLKALKTIAAMDPSLSVDGPGVEIEIPVQVFFAPEMKQFRWAVHGPMSVLNDVASAERLIKEEWTEYEQGRGKQALEPGSLRCTFVLEPMSAEFDYDTVVDAEMATTIHNLVHDNVWFSRLAVNLCMDMDSAGDEFASRTVFGQLVAAVLDNTRRSSEPAHTRFYTNLVNRYGQPRPLQFAAVDLDCDTSMEAQAIEALGSAMVSTQTTRKLLLTAPDAEATTVQWWKWLAYACFSKRARKCSTLESLSLCSIFSMNVEDMETFKFILTSSHPEEAIFGSPRGKINERDATLKRDATFHWMYDDHNGNPMASTEAFSLDSPIRCVRTFSDDGTSKYVTCLVPGYGRCQVQREDLDFYQGDEVDSSPCGLVSLRIEFTYDTIDSTGISSFLSAIGPSLKLLTLDQPELQIDENMIIQCCPNLQELHLSGLHMDVWINLATYPKDRPILGCHWNDIAALSNDLSQTSEAFIKCIRRLRLRLAVRALPGAVAYHYNAASYNRDLDALLTMLEINPSLEYVEIVVPSTYERYTSAFRKHHLQPTDRALKLPIESRIAVLSVVSFTRADTRARKRNQSQSISAVAELDHLVLSNIFAFAASPVLRQVFYQSVSPYHTILHDNLGIEDERDI